MRKCRDIEACTTAAESHIELPLDLDCSPGFGLTRPGGCSAVQPRVTQQQDPSFHTLAMAAALTCTRKVQTHFVNHPQANLLLQQCAFTSAMADVNLGLLA